MNEVMNKQEALKFFEGINLNFNSYYKYEFNYIGEKEGKKISVCFGGTEDVYREIYTPVEIFRDIDFEYFNVMEDENNNIIYIFSEN